MALIPLACTECSTIALSDRLIGGSGSIGTLVLDNVRFGSACPSCGSDMLAISGTYTVAEGITTFLDGPSRSIEQIRILLSLLRDVQQGILSAEDLADEVERKAPQLGELIRKLPIEAWAAWLPLLVMLVLNIINYRQSDRHHRASMELSTKQHAELVERSIRDAQEIRDAQVLASLDSLLLSLEKQSESPSDSLQGPPLPPE